MGFYTFDRSFLSSTALACCMTIPSILNAQENNPEFIGTVIIAESKREVATETATPETTVDQGEINDRQAGTVAELIDSVPGVHLINGSTPQGSGINIRGFGANGTYGTDQKVVILVDNASTGAEELYRIGNQLFTDPALFNSVSVIRGTVGSFEYGSGIVGGVVRMETKNASDFTDNEIGFKFRQALQFSSNEDGIVSSSVIAWQPSQNAELIANFTQRQQSDQRSGNGNKIGASAYNLPSWMIKGKYAFGENNSQAVTLSITDTKSDEKDVPYDAFQTTGGAFGNVDRKTKSTTVSLSYDFVPADNDFIDTNATFSYSDQKIDQEYVPGSSICGSFPLPPGCRGPAPVDGYSTVNADHRYETTKLTLKNTSLFDAAGVAHELRAGVENILKKRKTADSAPGGTDARMAFFVVDTIDIGPSLTLTPAIRYETQTITDDTKATGPYNNSAWMGGASAQFNISEEFSVFTSSAYTESLPIMDDLYNAFSTRPQPDLMKKSEKSRTTEFGASFDKNGLLQEGDVIKFKLTSYQTKLNDNTSYSSIDSVDRNGVELEASYGTISGFYSDLNYDQSSGTATSTAGAKTDWSNQPADTFRLTFGKKFLSNLDLSWEIYGADKFKNDTVEVSGFAAHSLRATYVPVSGMLSGTEIRLGIENATDREYSPRLSTRPAPGRNIKLSIAKTF